MNDKVIYSATNGIAVITLNRPEVLNALDNDLMQQLGTALKQATEDDQIRAVLITGAGRAFSSGADLTTIPVSELTSGKKFDLGQSLIERYNPIILSMRNMPKPIVSAVNGPAAGAGMSIALAADFVLASESASFLQAFARLGLVPDAGSTWFLPRLIGEQRARTLTMLAEPMKAAQAQQIGLVYQVVPDEQLMSVAHQLAVRLATQATQGLGLIKQALAASSTNTLEEQLGLEAQLQTRAGGTSDFIEGVTAFLQKRPARYTGK